MIAQIDEAINEAKKGMDAALEHLNHELSKIRTGKASPSMLSELMVEYYGSPTPLNQVANINASDAKTLTIQAWDKSMLGTIEKAIFEANLGLTPMNDGEYIRINIPALTEERRITLVKQAKHLGEEAKISLRSSRHKAIDFVKKSVKSGFSEDMGKRKEDQIEKIIHKYADKVDKLVELKEKDIMTI